MINLFLLNTLSWDKINDKRTGKCLPHNAPFWNKLSLPSFVSLLKKRKKTKKSTSLKILQHHRQMSRLTKGILSFIFYTIFLLLHCRWIYMILLWVHVKNVGELKKRWQEIVREKGEIKEGWTMKKRRISFKID